MAAQAGLVSEINQIRAKLDLSHSRKIEIGNEIEVSLKFFFSILVSLKLVMKLVKMKFVKRRNSSELNSKI